MSYGGERNMDKKAGVALISAVVIVGILVVALVMAAPRAKHACQDSTDNDGDGYTDWPSDPGCANRGDSSELNPSVQCDDGTDNDGDGAVDLADGGCSGPTDNDETNCGDGVCEGGETSATCPADCGFPDSCSDSDGGFAITVWGTVSGYSGGNPYNHSEYCLDNSSVMEHWCSGTQYYNNWASCVTNFSSICVGGRCV